MFVRNAWHVAAWGFELSNRTPLARTLLGERVVLYRTPEGRPAALADVCPHRLAPLSMGRIEGERLRCMYHGLAFGPDGRCVDVPGQTRITGSLSATAYPLVERDGYVWIWMGAPEKADPAKVTPRPWQSAPGWAWKPGYIHVKADYRLLMDNLLDFSHLAFVHEHSLGGPRALAEIEPRIERIDGGLRVTRWYFGLPVPPYLEGLAAFDGPVDRWQVYEWRTAGCLFDMDSGIRPTGRAPDEDASDLPRHRFHNIQSITPETERTSHFFWSYPRDFRLDDAALTDALADRLMTGFLEDKAIIEAQQENIDAHPERKMAAIAADAGVMQGRWMLAKLLAEEDPHPSLPP